MECSLPGSSVHGIFQASILEWIATPFSRGSSDPGIKPGSPALQADSLPSEPPGTQFITLVSSCLIRNKPESVGYKNIIGGRKRIGHVSECGMSQWLEKTGEILPLVVVLAYHTRCQAALTSGP